MSLSNLIDGRVIAEQLHGETSQRIVSLSQRGIQVGLAFVRVGEDPASQVYVGMKEKTAARLGVRSITHVLPEQVSQAELLELIHRLNADPSVHGILVQAPIPRQIDSAQIYSAVCPRKDVDGFHPMNVGKVLLGDRTAFLPCTPAGVHELLLRSQVSLAGAEVVVLGRGNIVGKPMASILMQKSPHANATVTVCHSHSRHVAEHCRRADIIIAAIGVPLFLKEDMVRAESVVIDVGVNRIADSTAKTGTRLVGDVDFIHVQPKVRKITPNPGGVGPMTIAMLMRNTVTAAENLSR
ncbi:MAG: bifunctional 5,10-methylenetetrahydrofolate dehydrogenase/5,10-methenyltetrahydrofolate cyclohydrolase [Verrucomicrobia bacterium]|nr:MAG: bifunctional 5,10-methylenetetrahydrofolate dehydrogenase/5,10-methenyltetrahydrofolate cyclohydrolase [Verrucomicrobiota bacterium]